MPRQKTTPTMPRPTKPVPLRYQPEFCSQLLVTKRDGSVALVETAAELPTFASFAKKLGTTCEVLKQWETKHPAFHEAAQKARDLQSNILIQNSLRGNYSASFAVFTAKNLLGWTDPKDEPASPAVFSVSWEEE